MNETRQVVILTTVSFLTFSVARYSKDNALPQTPQLIAWGVLFVMLVTVSDFPQTASIAAAMAWLITLTIFLSYGVDFFAKISAAVTKGN